jgi:hypothetical protein
MKKLLILISTLVLGNSNDLVYPNGKHERFLVDKKSRSINTQHRVYYRHGIISPKTACKDSRKLYVSFGKSVDIQKFAKKYKIKFIKMTNKKFYTALFLVEDSRDIIDLCSLINKSEDIRYSQPHWNSSRNLK